MKWYEFDQPQKSRFELTNSSTHPKKIANYSLISTAVAPLGEAVAVLAASADCVSVAKRESSPKGRRYAFRASLPLPLGETPRPHCLLISLISLISLSPHPLNTADSPSPRVVLDSYAHNVQRVDESRGYQVSNRHSNWVR
ncbi:hypothetical protein NIES4103_03280 [Nostoc sp. NIES-4103]|nr:hypothetical protein NIES4103_03280 [Nostoc sp. NIES-4103]